jgi:hypothetical protein
MTTMSTHKIIVAVEVVVVCAIMLDLTREYFGREALWALGIAGLPLALLALARLGK